MRKPKRFHVYIMTNRPRSHVLYTGITGNLTRRVFQHKNKLVPGFTSRYNLTRLVFYECFVYPDAAIAREKEIKSAVTVDLAPAPTGPAAMLASPPILKDVDSSEFRPFSVITTMITSDTSTPAWNPTLAVARS